MTWQVPSSDALVGRLQELELLQRFADHARVTGASLLVSGEPGIGKTALLTAASELAQDSGTTVLRVAGSEFEANVSFGALKHALFPLLDQVEELNAVHAQALRVTLELSQGEAPDRLLVANAVTLLLRRAAASSPLLIIIDDLPWIDRASATTLSFAARRLSGSRAGILAAFRTGAASYFDPSGLPELVVSRLDGEAASQLLAQHFPALDPRVRERVLATAQGNPLALLELPQALTEPQQSAVQPLPQVMPLGLRLQQLFASRIQALPVATRTLLLAAALEGTGDLATLKVMSPADEHLDALTPAEHDQLVAVETRPARLVFRHPLIRSAVVEAAAPAEIRRTHLALADVFASDLERRASHLGNASLGPDEQVAALLEEAAHRVLRRGDYPAVVSLLCRAADLSPDPATRSRRLTEAAYVGAETTAAAKITAGLLEAARRAGQPGVTPLNYASAAAFVMLDDDAHVEAIHQLLVKAIEDSPHRRDGSNQELVNALWSLALISYVGGWADYWAPLHAFLAGLSAPAPSLLTMTVDMFADPVRTGAASLPSVKVALRAAAHTSDANYVQNVAGCAFYADLLAEVREPLWRAILDGRDGGPARKRLVALMDVCVDDFHRGEWQEQAELATEGLSICEDLGGRFFSWYFTYHQSLLAAVHGRFEEAGTLAQQMIDWAEPRGVGTAQTYARHALVLADIGKGDWESAYHLATAISPAGILASHVPHALWVAMDLVDAAVRTGRHEDAIRHVQALREADIAALSPRLAIHLAAAEAIISPEDAASDLYHRALTLPTADQWPFDTARIRLLYGEHLRRTRALTQARTELNQALATFQKLGAVPWTRRAERELRAAGHTLHSPAQSRTTAALGVLSTQELQIARLAARGKTNKQIAEHLFLSPRTVSGHLYRIFPKLGITSRAALRDAIGTDEV